MTFEWDKEKERRNIEKHDGITFNTAARVFSDKHAVIKYDSRHSTLNEDRWNIIGMVDEFLFVVYTEREENRVRIISARFATKEEIDEYYRNYDAR